MKPSLVSLSVKWAFSVLRTRRTDLFVLCSEPGELSKELVRVGTKRSWEQSPMAGLTRKSPVNSAPGPEGTTANETDHVGRPKALRVPAPRSGPDNLANQSGQ